MISNDLKRGQVILLDNAPCIVIETSSQSPSARGGQTLIKTRYRNLLTDQVLEKAFKAGERVLEADFEKRKGQFLYAEGDNGIFMDLENYEQYEVGDETFGSIKGYLVDGFCIIRPDTGATMLVLSRMSCWAFRRSSTEASSDRVSAISETI